MHVTQRDQYEVHRNVFFFQESHSITCRQQHHCSVNYYNKLIMMLLIILMAYFFQPSLTRELNVLCRDTCTMHYWWCTSIDTSLNCINVRHSCEEQCDVNFDFENPTHIENSVVHWKLMCESVCVDLFILCTPADSGPKCEKNRLKCYKFCDEIKKREISSDIINPSINAQS